MKKRSCDDNISITLDYFVRVLYSHWLRILFIYYFIFIEKTAHVLFFCALLCSISQSHLTLFKSFDIQMFWMSNKKWDKQVYSENHCFKYAMIVTSHNFLSVMSKLSSATRDGGKNKIAVGKFLAVLFVDSHYNFEKKIHRCDAVA